MSEKFIKLCPKCGDKQSYSTPQNYYKALKRNRQCRKCMFNSLDYKTKHVENTKNMWSDENKKFEILQKRNSEESKLKWKKSISPTVNSVDYKKKQSKIQKQILTKESVELRSERMKKIWKDPNSSFHKEDFRLKLRESRIKQMKNLGVVTNNYNPEACKYFDRLNTKNGWNLRHALNGGEVKKCGYWLDSYDETLNIVVEYDEPHHYKFGNVLRKKDVIRQNRIITTVGCKFLRYNENQQNLYEVTVGKEK